MRPSAPPAAYRETLHVPVTWWLLAGAFVVSVWLALVVALPPLLVWVLTALVAAAAIGLLAGYGSARVETGEHGLRAGRAVLEWAACGPASPLDAEAARRLRGVDADARAYLVLRPYLPLAVRVDVQDTHDPTPYWLVATRRPEELAAAINAGRRHSEPRQA